MLLCPTAKTLGERHCGFDGKTHQKMAGRHWTELILRGKKPAEGQDKEDSVTMKRKKELKKCARKGKGKHIKKKSTRHIQIQFKELDEPTLFDQ